MTWFEIVQINIAQGTSETIARHRRLDWATSHIKLLNHNRPTPTTRYVLAHPR